MRRLVLAEAPGMTQFHLVVWAVPTAVIAHVGPGRGEGLESERRGHAERDLQE